MASLRGFVYIVEKHSLIIIPFLTCNARLLCHQSTITDKTLISVKCVQAWEDMGGETQEWPFFIKEVPGASSSSVPASKDQTAQPTTPQPKAGSPTPPSGHGGAALGCLRLYKEFPNKNEISNTCCDATSRHWKLAQACAQTNLGSLQNMF